MTFTAIRGGLVWPFNTWESTNNQSKLLDASGERWASRILVPKAGDLAQVRFRTGVVTTGGTIRVSFQDNDDTTGNPDGTQDQYRDVTVANGDDSTWLLSGLITSDGTDGGSLRTVTKGQRPWVVWEFPSYSSENLNLVDSSVPSPLGAINDIYSSHYTGGAWTKSASWGCFELIYSDGSIEPTFGTIPAISGASTSIGNGSAVREQGNYFQVPVPMKVDGCLLAVDVDGDMDVILYDSDGTTVLASVAVKAANRHSTNIGNFPVDFGAEVTLSTGTWYRVVWKPTTATALTGRQMSVNALASLDAMPGGQFCYWTEKSSGGSWSQDTTKVAKIWLRVSAVHNGTGGSTRSVIVGG